MPQTQWQFMERNLLVRARVIVLTTGLLLAALPLFAKTAPHRAIEETVTIENSGSTNTIGYKIVVSSRGSVSYGEAGAKARTQALSKDSTAKLFSDVAAAMPLTALPVRHGMRSASFGTQTCVAYRGQKSPDLTIPAGPRATALYDDILVIEKALHIGNHLRRPFNRPAQP